MSGVIALVLLCILSSFGCTLVVDHTPKQLKIESGKVANLHLGSPVNLINAQPATTPTRVESRHLLVMANYNHYTDALLDLIRAEVEKNGGSVSPRANRVMKLAIINVSLVQSLVDYFCTVDATVELGEGQIYGFNARSAGSATAAIDNGIVNLAVAILNDRRVLSFLKL